MKSPRRSAGKPRAARKSTAKRCNGLDGRRWLQNSISVWNDIRKSPEEQRLKHPALFPQMLVDRLIETFLPPAGEVILDPFAGTGSTLVAAEAKGKCGIGFELSAEFVEIARDRLNSLDESRTKPLRSIVHHASAVTLRSHVLADSVDLCITSPPYWDILNQRRTADMKAVRHYGNLDGDLGLIEDYEEFLDATTDVSRNVLAVLRPGCYCCIVVMDLRKKNRFFPLHSDLARRLEDAGFIFDDLIIWNRQAEYNNLRPLGYPAVFRINKVHEYILLMQKPKA